MQGFIIKNIQLKFSATSGLFWIESSRPKTLSYVVLVKGSTENLSIIYQWPFFTFCCSPNQTRTHLFETRKLISSSKIYKAINHFDKKLISYVLNSSAKIEDRNLLLNKIAAWNFSGCSEIFRWEPKKKIFGKGAKFLKFRWKCRIINFMFRLDSHNLDEWQSRAKK